MGEAMRGAGWTRRGWAGWGSGGVRGGETRLRREAVGVEGGEEGGVFGEMGDRGGRQGGPPRGGRSGVCTAKQRGAAVQKAEGKGRLRESVNAHVSHAHKLLCKSLPPG